MGVTKTNNISRLIVLIPLFGALLFVCLYIVATLLYPGGSQADKNAVGFSWAHNYWCNLLNVQAINGQANPARPVALTAMLVLCITLAMFWFLFVRIINFSAKASFTISFSGFISMCVAMFLFTSYHDMVINVSGFFGLIALTGTFVGLYKSRWFSLFIVGLVNLGLVIVNNILYYSGSLKYLPIIQKISFLFFLVWICWIDVRLYLTFLNKSLRVGA